MKTASDQPALGEILEAREFRLILVHHQVTQSGQEIPHVVPGLLPLFVGVVLLLQQIRRVELIESFLLSEGVVLQLPRGGGKDGQESLARLLLVLGVWESQRPQRGIEGLDMSLNEVDIGHDIIGLILQLNDQVSRADHMSPTHCHFFYLIIFQVHFDRSCGGKGISLQE
jgi:hypothetical protein